MPGLCKVLYRHDLIFTSRKHLLLLSPLGRWGNGGERIRLCQTHTAGTGLSRPTDHQSTRSWNRFLSAWAQPELHPPPSYVEERNPREKYARDLFTGRLLCQRVAYTTGKEEKVLRTRKRSHGPSCDHQGLVVSPQWMWPPWVLESLGEEAERR